jgi:hypothetical protein
MTNNQSPHSPFLLNDAEMVHFITHGFHTLHVDLPDAAISALINLSDDPTVYLPDFKRIAQTIKTCNAGKPAKPYPNSNILIN